MTEIDHTQLEELLIEKKGEGYSSDNIRVIEKDVSASLFETDAVGVPSYNDQLDKRYGKGGWGKVKADKADHYHIVAYIDPGLVEPEKPEDIKDEIVYDPETVLWAKSDGVRTLTLLRGGLYDKK